MISELRQFPESPAAAEERRARLKATQTRIRRARMLANIIFYGTAAVVGAAFVALLVYR